MYLLHSAKILDKLLPHRGVAFGVGLGVGDVGIHVVTGLVEITQTLEKPDRT